MGRWLRLRAALLPRFPYSLFSHHSVSLGEGRCPSWWTLGLRLGPDVRLEGDSGTRFLCWGCLHSGVLPGGLPFPPSEQGWVPWLGPQPRLCPIPALGMELSHGGMQQPPSLPCAPMQHRDGINGWMSNPGHRQDAGCAHSSSWALPPGLTGFGFRHCMRTGLCLYPVGGHVQGPRHCLLPGALAWFSKS